MAHLTIYKDSYVDSTIVSNKFIDDYMKDANDAQLKVYLYLIRMLNAHQSTSVSDIADKFNHTEKDVLRAFKYWEKKQLLSLDFDDDKNLVGIHLRDLTRSDPADEGALSPTVVLNASSQTQVQSRTCYEKPLYTPDQLRAFKARQDTAQLLFIAESYIGKPLTPSEIKTIFFFTDVLEFSDDLIDYLIQYCVDRNKKDFKYIEKVAVTWAEEGIRTPKQAESFASRYDKNVYSIMSKLNRNRAPTPKELEYINRWTKDYGFSIDIIFEACERTLMNTDKNPFPYTEAILSSWKKHNVCKKADICQAENIRQQQNRKIPAKSSAANKFNQFPQNNYDFEQLEKELLSN